MPKTTVTSGYRCPPEYFNAINSPVFDDQDLDGHNPRLTDDALSSAPGNIKPQWQAFRDMLKVSAGSGLTITWTAGTVTKDDGTIASITTGSTSVPANSTRYVYALATGVFVDTALPVRCLPLATVTTTASAISTIEDLRPRFEIAPLNRGVRVFGGSGGSGNYTLNSGSATLSGLWEFQDFTITQGATLTIDGSALIRCSGKVTIAGVINVSAPVRGGGGFVGIFGPQAYPNTQGQGVGGGGSVNASAAPAYSWLVSKLGSGGAGPWMIITTSGGGTLTTSGGGNGGGALEIEAAGAIEVSGQINADGGAGGSLTSGTSGYVGQISGTGGGSGGLISLQSLTSIVVTAAGQLSVRGGNGGNGWPSPTGQFSGGGGGGGWIVLISPSVNTTGASLLRSGGSSTYATGFGAVAGGSFGGTGGAPGQIGATGQLLVRTVIPG